MNYISTIQASEKWGISTTRITILAKNGRIPGAVKMGNSWLIPKNTPKPTDGRTKAAKAEIKENFFRFPLYVNGEENSFTPPLSAEEKMLRQAQLDFFACDFQEAEKKLKKLSEDAENIYVRMMSLFFMCWLSDINNSGNLFKNYYNDFQIILSANDFPHKKDMELLLPWLLTIMTLYKDAAESFEIDINYEYSPSVYPLMAYLSFIGKESMENSKSVASSFDIYEIEIKQMEKDGYLFEAQQLHLTLFLIYYIKNDKSRTKYHLKKAIDIAYNNNFICSIADAFSYYQDVFNKILNEYPTDFANKVRIYGKSIDESFSKFTSKNDINEIFLLLSANDIKFILYAVDGCSNKQIAKILHISERTVANRYSEIYNKLGIDGKQELLEMINEI